MTQVHDPHDKVPATKPHLLVVDDEIEVAKSLQRQFRRTYDVHIATNAEDALRILSERPIQVVISDQRMPRITGVEFFAHIKDTHPDTIRILLTGYADIEAVIAAINDGSVFRYIKKPWDRAELEKVLGDAYERHNLMSENERLLNELRQSERRYRALFENSPVAMLEVDLSVVSQQISRLPISAGETLGHYWDTHSNAAMECLKYVKIKDCNLALVQMLQMSGEGVLENTFAELFETALSGFLRSLIIALHDGKQVWNQEVTLPATQGGPTHLFAYAAAVPGDEKTGLRSIMVLADITERKRAEAALQHMLQRETELNNLRSAIITTISHEFRTPLAIIQSSSEVLAGYADRLNADQRQRHSSNLGSSIRRLTGLLDDVSLFSKIEAGEIEINRQTLDLEALCRQLISDLETDETPKPLIQLTCNGECTRAFLDPDIVSTILRHLLENAIKYSTVDSVIGLTATCDEMQTTICVSDQGVGIPSSEQKHIFDVFAQVSNKGTKRGIGLGLALVKRLVELHDGSIDVATEEGRGTEFCVAFPLH